MSTGLTSFLILISVITILVVVGGLVIRGLYKGKVGTTSTVSTTGLTLPAWLTSGKFWKVLWRLAVIVIAAFWIHSCARDHREDLEYKSKMMEIEKAKEVKTADYDFYWKLKSGRILGRTEAARDERIAERVNLEDISRLDFDQRYLADDEPEVMRIRMLKVGPKSWEGYHEQGNPRCSGRISVDEIAPGIYAGNISFDNGAWGTCQFKKK